MELRRGDKTFIADSLNCSLEYVKKVLNGDRESKSRLAKKILMAKDTILQNRSSLKKQLSAAA